MPDFKSAVEQCLMDLIAFELLFLSLNVYIVHLFFVKKYRK